MPSKIPFRKLEKIFASFLKEFSVSFFLSGVSFSVIDFDIPV